MPPAGLKILVHESETATLQVLSLALESEGYQVISSFEPDPARAAEDIKQLVDEHDPALIIYDVPHPYEAHWAAARELQRTVAGGRPVIFITTGPIPEEETRVFRKPFDLDALVEAVRALATGQ